MSNPEIGNYFYYTDISKNLTLNNSNNVNRNTAAQCIMHLHDQVIEGIEDANYIKQ